MADKIGYILGNFPSGTETFVFNEIEGLQQLGLDITLFSFHKQFDNKNHLDYKSWLPKTIYAYPSFSWKIILSHLYFIFNRPWVYFELVCKYKEFGGKKAFWVGVYFSAIIKKKKIIHVHAHFAWVATDVARIISRLMGIPFSFTAHQSDIHRTSERLSEKLNEAKFILTCTKGNKEYLGNKYGKEVSAKTFAVYHGVNIDKFLPEDGKVEKEIDVLSIGNLIKVKGFEYLIKACALLKEDNLFKKCVIMGSGEEKDNLESLIQQMGLKDKIEVREPVPYDEVVNFYKRAKIFALPVTVIDGAPHGIPNVLVEAMAMEMPVISSCIPNIMELIENEKDGILVPDKSPEKVARAIEKLLSNKELRFRLGVNAREKITEDFDSKKHIRKIADLFVRDS